MNYKDLFDRYKKGLVTDEEKILIEKEIEKVEALEEYFASTFDGELNINADEKLYEEETRKLKKSVNQKLQKAVIKWTLVIFAIYFVIFYGVSGIVDMIYYDPTSTSESEKMEDMKQDFIYDMQSYVSLNKPGYSISSFIGAQSKGFGNYKVNYYYGDLFEKKDTNYFFDISKGRMSYILAEGIFNFERKGFEGFRLITHEFSEDEESEEGDYNHVKLNNQKTIDYLNKLNPLSYISISIIFNEDMTMREYFDFSQELKPLRFKWVGIRTMDKGDNWKSNNSNSIIGFNPNFSDEPSSTMRPNLEKYPLFYLADMKNEANQIVGNYPDIISKAYETHFKTRLDYLRNREDFIEMVGNKKEFYDYSADYVDKNGVNTYGVLVYGTAEEFLKYIEKIPYESIIINEISSVKPNIYYD